jgi:endonuclease G, mitochondrial
MPVTCLLRRHLLRSLRSVLNLALLAMCCSGCVGLAPAPPATDGVNLLLGNPSHQLSLNPKQYQSFIRPQYALLYDRDKNTATWASWQLNETWLGTEARLPFTPDPELLKLGAAITPSDYTNSGFDRGHLVPAADRNHTREDAIAVFYMSNIVPQAPDNNRGPWEALESYCRSLVRAGKELYIIAGPVGVGGNGSEGNAATIAQGKVTVPAALWKIIVVNAQPGLGLSGISEKTRVIAVVMPNSQGIKNKVWTEFRTTVRDLEQQTGLDFLSNLPTAVQDSLETQPDRLTILKKKKRQEQQRAYERP